MQYLDELTAEMQSKEEASRDEHDAAAVRQIREQIREAYAESIDRTDRTEPSPAKPVVLRAVADAVTQHASVVQAIYASPLRRSPLRDSPLRSSLSLARSLPSS